MESRNYVKKNEWMAYAVGALGQGMVYGIMSSYISDFYLNVLKVTPIFVLMLMLLTQSMTRLWATLWTTPTRNTAKCEHICFSRRYRLRYSHFFFFTHRIYQQHKK